MKTTETDSARLKDDPLPDNRLGSGPEAPDISIITATYNRSRVLRHTIASVLAQQCPCTWEHIVIGDACTDDTEALLGDLADPRLHFFNLPHNVGEQSGPNNEGFKRARGRYIAYINHDDLWFPDHLERALGNLESQKADGVFCQGLILHPDGSVRLCGVSEDGQYNGNMGVPASTWLMKRETIEQLGGWRSGWDLYTSASQDFLLRARRAGLKIVMVSAATVLICQSGSRKDCYLTGDDAEQAQAMQAMRTDPGYREHLLHRGMQRLECLSDSLPTRALLRRAAGNVLKRLGGFFGYQPAEFIQMVRYRRKGELIRRLRRIRGLPKHPQSKRTFR